RYSGAYRAGECWAITPASAGCCRRASARHRVSSLIVPEERTLPRFDVRVLPPNQGPPEFLHGRLDGANGLPKSLAEAGASLKACFKWLGHCWEAEVTL